MSIPPSMRVIILCLNSHPNINNKKQEAISTAKSILVISRTYIGATDALVPTTRKILNRLEPITFPIAISGFFFKAATTEVANSGKEVPAATNVMAITDSLTPKLRAIPEAPSTKNCPPYTKPTNPNTINKTLFQSGIDFISTSFSDPLRAMANV